MCDFLYIYAFYTHLCFFFVSLPEITDGIIDEPPSFIHIFGDHCYAEDRKVGGGVMVVASKTVRKNCEC